MLKTNNENVPPACFGQSFDAKDKLCVGGYDPIFTGNNSKIRPACNFSTACASRIQGRASAQHQQLVPPSSLVRPHTTVTPPSSAPLRPPYPTYGGPSMRAPAYGPQQPAPPPYAATQHLPGMNNVPVGHFSMPQYLTVREAPDSGHVVKRLSFELLRSMGKSFGHTLANFFDTDVFGRRPGPPDRQP